MFYNDSLLNHRRGGLGVIWLIATLGNRTSLRKVTKRELDNVNIVKACQSVITPPEPVALRLSAQLMYGVIRVYSQKSEQLLADVSAMHATVRKSSSFISVAIVMGGSDVDMPRMTHHRNDILTIPENTAPYATDFDRPFAWDWELNNGNDSVGIASTSGISSGAHLPLSPTPSALGRERYTAPKDKITLPSHRRQDSYYMDTEDARGEHRSQSLDMDMIEVGADDGLALDLGLGEGFEFPPLESTSYHLPRVEAADLSSSQDGGAILDWQYDDGGFDSGLGEGIQINHGGADVGDLARVQVRGEAHEDMLYDGAMPPPEIPQKAKRKRVSFSLEDARIELTGEEARALPHLYIRHMELEQAQRSEQEYARQAENFVKKQLLFAPPDDITGDSDLLDFWKITVGSEVERIEENLIDYRRALAAENGQAVAHFRSMRNGRDLLDVQHTAEYSAARQLSDADFVNQQDFPQLDDFDMPFNAQGPDATDSSLESVGRARAGSYDSAALPWNLPILPRDEMSGSHGARTPRSHRSISIGSISTQILGRQGSIPLESPARDVAVGVESGRFDQGEEEDRLMYSQVMQSEVHKETRNFLEFAKRIAAEVEPAPLFFSDLAPVADSMPPIAAQAFYHLLQLATNLEISLQQDHPYGEILVLLA